jgi:hypothetical protein
MGVVETQRTVVKSVPELWAELSEVTLLGRMLHGQFGEIGITRLTPESSIEWQGALASGSVELEPGGFGTRVRLTAQIAQTTPAAVATNAAAAPRRSGLLARLFGRRPTPSAPAATPEVAASVDPARAQSALTAVLDEIGAARHRPFSREPGAAPQITYRT